jgi:lysylphosphatidylglycerol synthetase-like protein (DUF2156 family)
MVSLPFFFFFFMGISAIIGAMRGWAKEMMVSFSLILAMFIVSVLERYVSVVRDSLAVPGSLAQFWLRTIIVILLVFFGYQTPNIAKFGGQRFVRERLQDSLLGIFLGALNGYLIFGTLWYFMAQANYPFPNLIRTPQATDPMGDLAMKMVAILPPNWLGIPTVYFAVAVAFLFVLVVFI